MLLRQPNRRIVVKFTDCYLSYIWLRFQSVQFWSSKCCKHDGIYPSVGTQGIVAVEGCVGQHEVDILLGEVGSGQEIRMCFWYQYTP